MNVNLLPIKLASEAQLLCTATDIINALGVYSILVLLVINKRRLLETIVYFYSRQFCVSYTTSSISLYIRTGMPTKQPAISVVNCF